MNSDRVIRLDPTDNVVVAVDAIPIGRSILGIEVRQTIPRGHKLAVSKVERGAPVLKYGEIIGFASQDIEPGQHVHDHNVVVLPFDRDAGPPAAHFGGFDVPGASATFEGFRRGTGTGTRNYVAIVSSVNCSASVARLAERRIAKLGLLDDHPDVDGVVVLTHSSGCGMAADGPGFEVLHRTIEGYVRHPNFGAVVMVGLGCEVFQIPRFQDRARLSEGDLFRTVTIQQAGGSWAAAERIVEAVREALPIVSTARRETRPASELILAMQCGGSDAYSGLTANPALGHASDLLVAQGGTSVLSETPEIYGAEHLLALRATDRRTADRLMERIRWWKRYVESHGGNMNNNPSPGNKTGGITTILEKSLGAIAKAGKAPLRAVYEFAEPIDERGLVYMDGPGYDPTTATGQVASGCNVMCFTTGRGSVFGCKPTPSLKLSSNSALAEAMPDDIDIDCGDVLEGTLIAHKGEQIFAAILATASGCRTKSEGLDLGDMEFVPWQLGAVM